MPENNNIQEVENKSRVEQLLEAWANGDEIELWAPQSNIERILMNILGATGIEINPIQSRNEALLLQILENGGGSGGGESSDFSTATLKILGINESEYLDIKVPEVIDMAGFPPALICAETLPGGDHTIALYKGLASCVIDINPDDYEISGDYDAESSTIFGDATLTYTGA